MPKTDLTSRQVEALGSIEGFIQDHGYSPTVRELMVHLDLRSTQSVHYLLQQLRTKGVIEWAPGKSRTLKVTNPVTA